MVFQVALQRGGGGCGAIEGKLQSYVRASGLPLAFEWAPPDSHLDTYRIGLLIKRPKSEVCISFLSVKQRVPDRTGSIREDGFALSNSQWNAST